MKEEIKAKQAICAHCAHLFHPHGELYLCALGARPLQEEPRDPVTGERSYEEADYAQGIPFRGIFYPHCRCLNQEGQCREFEKKPPKSFWARWRDTLFY